MFLSHHFIILLVHLNNRMTNCLLLASILKDAYITGTRKQKMMISKENVEAIYSMQPPGRFLKKCADTGEWKELSEREATNKAAQAMAYLVIVQEKKKRKTQHSHSLHSSSSSNATSCAVRSQLADCRPILHFQANHHGARIVPASMSSSSGVRRQWGEGTIAYNNGGGQSKTNIPRDDELLPHKFSLHHQLREMQQSSISLSGDGTPQPQTKPPRHQQRQSQLHHDYPIGRHEQNELLPHTRLPSSSLPTKQSSIAPVHRAGMLRNLISTAVGRV